MKRLSCMVGLHTWEPVQRHEVIAETKEGWVYRMRHFEQCTKCKATTPAHIAITHTIDSVPDEMQSRLDRLCSGQEPDL